MIKRLSHRQDIQHSTHQDAESPIDDDILRPRHRATSDRTKNTKNTRRTSPMRAGTHTHTHKLNLKQQNDRPNDNNKHRHPKKASTKLPLPRRSYSHCHNSQEQIARDTKHSHTIHSLSKSSQRSEGRYAGSRDSERIRRSTTGPDVAGMPIPNPNPTWLIV
jgi:hypothetical protein